MGKVLQATLSILTLLFFATVAAINSIGLFSMKGESAHLQANVVDTVHERAVSE